ncbi:MAG: hypothetical protein IMY85_01380 [Chloroflexi bacterium]|nr:hypothetical protein [Chloroflexota bacterium]
MKKKLFTILVFLALVLGLGVPLSQAMAGSPRTPVQAWEIPQCVDPDPHPDCTPGEWTYPDGNMHVRNMVQIYNAIGINDDRLTGTNTLVVNANWDAFGFGPGWGTFHNQSAYYDGYWEGTFAALMTSEGYVSRIVGQGYGEFDGLVIKATEVNGFLEGVILALPNH